MFQRYNANIIRDHHKNDNVDEKTKIIKTAIELIQNDIRLATFDSTSYPSVDTMKNIKKQNANFHQVLEYFWNLFQKLISVSQPGVRV